MPHSKLLTVENSGEQKASWFATGIYSAILKFLRYQEQNQWFKVIPGKKMLNDRIISKSPQLGPDMVGTASNGESFCSCFCCFNDVNPTLLSHYSKADFYYQSTWALPSTLDFLSSTLLLLLLWHMIPKTASRQLDLFVTLFRHFYKRIMALMLSASNQIHGIHLNHNLSNLFKLFINSLLGLK